VSVRHKGKKGKAKLLKKGTPLFALGNRNMSCSVVYKRKERYMNAADVERRGKQQAHGRKRKVVSKDVGNVLFGAQRERLPPLLRERKEEQNHKRGGLSREEGCRAAMQPSRSAQSNRSALRKGKRRLKASQRRKKKNSTAVIIGGRTPLPKQKIL